RAAVGKLGLAPITGMFLFGEEMPGRFGDYRPEVHDADGLLMQRADGELDWRPLRNPKQTRVSRFQVTDPRGFGLMQRDRNFNHYEDLETEMQIRPSIWVTPGSYRFVRDADTPTSVSPTAGQTWGDGWVELFEIASDDEGIDNIGAYWVPAHETEIAPGSRIEFTYRLDFTQDQRPAERGVMPWVATRTMFGEGRDEEANAKSLVRTAVGAEARGRPVARFIIDTAPDTALPSGTIVRSDVAVTNGQIAGEPVIQYNKFNHAYRLFFDVIADGDQPVELRATLRGATALDRKKEQAPEGKYDDVVDPDTGPPLSETWLYRWDPP
ncbi:MAG: glucan biosynthesis protein, partial [Planctomycetota bacterium]